VSAIDNTLKQLLSEIFQCHREIEALRRRVQELEAAQQQALDPPAPETPKQEGTP
jgi:BMFP domain-containing protein YqiC